ncbi:hypothetical protein H0H81_004144 [Sphagnurus paluster]|uniref:Uncharacterized protein n=1 Tax=Sphagnurus paluster TaxID=117069 RepID=A0A9P7FYT3_9AGAR|nr:hypothetical protein H0H81_004144 [Sphagnurus paluster]
MYFDLNVPIPNFVQSSSQVTSKKGKGKQQSVAPSFTFTASQINGIETRVDFLVRLGYTVIAFNQLVHKKVDPKTHTNVVDVLVGRLKKRPGIVYLRRLSIILDEDSEKGFGLTNANASIFTSYDLIGLIPLTQATFSLACLTHSMPSPLTAHIISLPLTLPRLSFYLKHTLIRTAIKNGAVFEISYVGALGGENDPILCSAGGAENGSTAKRNWWAATKELTRVTKGRSLLVSGGVLAEADLRAPADVANLIALLGLPQDVARSSSTKVPKSLVLRAQTRSTYRAVFSEPTVVIPGSPSTAVSIESQLSDTANLDSPTLQSKKRPREGEVDTELSRQGEAATITATGGLEPKVQKKRKKNKGGQ